MKMLLWLFRLQSLVMEVVKTWLAFFLSNMVKKKWIE